MITSFRILDDDGIYWWVWDGKKVYKEGEEEDCSFDADDFNNAIAYLIDTGSFYKKFKNIIEGLDN